MNDITRTKAMAENRDLEDRRAGVKYRDLNRDPERIREEFILRLLLDRPHTAQQIRDKAKGNAHGFSMNTYTADLRGLVLRKLILEPGNRGGTYMIHPINGLQYCQTKGYT